MPFEPENSSLIFMQPWWLDAVAPGQWREVLVVNGGGVRARLPYVAQKKFGCTILGMPPLTQVLGPWFRPSAAKYPKRLKEQKDLIGLLIAQLPHFDYFLQNFHYSLTNWLPFYWNGFQQTTRYTYVLEDLSDLKAVWEGMQSNIRTDIKKARERFGLVVETDLGIEAFWELNTMTFRRQNIPMPYSFDLVRRLDLACEKKKARKVFFAIDPKGVPHAAVFLVWDSDSAYYLMGGGDPDLRNSGATSLLLWEAIRFASKVTKKFDFEGSMIESVERFFRAFGAKQVPYFQVSSAPTKKMRLLLSTRDLCRGLLGR